VKAWIRFSGSKQGSVASRMNMEIKFHASLNVKNFLTTYGTTNLKKKIKHNNLTYYNSTSKIKICDFLTIKPTLCTNFSNLFFEWNSTCFGQFLCPSSGVFHCTHRNGIFHTGLLIYTIAVCTVKNSWWWTEELSETRRFSFQV